MSGANRLPKNAFEQAFINDKPKQVTGILQNRLKRSENISTSLSLYFKDRALIEQEYARKLSKLTARPIVEDSQDDAGWAAVLGNLETELGEVIRQHEVFAKRLEEQIVIPLRERARSGDTSLKQHEATISSIAKEHDDAQSRLSKAQTKSSKKNKLETSQDELNMSYAQWLSSAPAYLHTVQKAERSRLEQIKENLAKYETLQSDLGRERMEMAERGLMSFIAWEFDDDIQTFLLRSGSARATTTLSTERGQGTAGRTPTEDRRASVSSYQRQAPSIMSDHSSSQQPAQKGGFLSTLSSKIKGPGLSRTRSSSHSIPGYGNLDDSSRVHPSTGSGVDPVSESTISDADTTGLTSATMPQNHLDDSEPSTPMEVLQPQIMATQPSDDRPPMTTTPSHSSASDREKGKGKRRESFLPFSLNKRKNSLARSASSAGRYEDGFPGSYPPTPENVSGEGSLLAVPSNRNGTPDITQPPRTNQTNPFAMIDTNHVVSNNTMAQNNVDAEGYTIPPDNRAAEPWSSSPRSLMDEDDESGNTAKLNVEIAQAPLQPVQQESAAEREAALERVRNALSTSSSSNVDKVGRRSTNIRGRRSTYNPVGDDAPLSQIRPLPSSQPSLSPESSIVSPQTNGRGSSILSKSSSREVFSPPDSATVANPFENMEGNGLRASIVETLNVLSKTGQVPKVMVTGEIALLLTASSASSFKLRLIQGQNLNKLAPNGAILQSSGQQLFDVNASALGSSSSPVTVLKYQLSIPQEEAQKYIPLNVYPMWKCEESQTSILISYSLNASSIFAGNEGASPFDDSPASQTTLSDLSLLVPITSSDTSNLQSKPTAVYNAEKKRLLWKLGDVNLGTAGQQKALARFNVPEASVAQPVSVKWKMLGRTLSGVSLEIVESADGSTTRIEEISQAVQSGKYLIA